jgi:hypothetical protein
MSSPTLEPPAAALAGRWQAAILVVAIAAICCVAISGRSLWIDEACSSMKVLPPTLGGWWQELSEDRSADVQMPLYMFYVWAWARVFGTSEWSLHWANAPWFAVGALAFILAFPFGDRRRVSAACVVLLCPFTWYYLDEARPYAMQLGASLLILVALARLERGRELSNATKYGATGWDVAIFLFGVVVLSGSSLLGMVWAGSAMVAMLAFLSPGGTLRLVQRHWHLWVAATGLLLVFAGYYLWTLSLGARASAAATTTLGSVLFIGYELLGFSGLGPGRLELRSAGAAGLRSHLPLLALYAATIAMLVGAVLRQDVRKGNRRYLMLALCYVVPAAFILGVGWVAHFRVLGRHFTPLLPALLLLLVSGLAALWSHRRAWAKAVALLFCLLSLGSCLSLRFLPRHEKDNYRAAATLAKTALGRGQRVWWSAAEVGARYYGVPLTTNFVQTGAALLVLNPGRETLAPLPVPRIVVTSKPDIYDSQMALADYLREQRFEPVARFTAFTIWEKGER